MLPIAVSCGDWLLVTS
uniref:Uncharacterized protein n=1 Tax=Anguilla anguilla TaxID=7936 RepID=A0A0E9UPA1_ANGAN